MSPILIAFASQIRCLKEAASVMVSIKCFDILLRDPRSLVLPLPARQTDVRSALVDGSSRALQRSSLDGKIQLKYKKF